MENLYSTYIFTERKRDEGLPKHGWSDYSSVPLTDTGPRIGELSAGVGSIAALSLAVGELLLLLLLFLGGLLAGAFLN